MSGESTASSSQQNIPHWAANALIIAAGICLITSLGLAIADKVAAGTLTAGLFVVCVLFLYLPQMQSFKAWGIEATWRAVRATAGEVHRAEAEVERARQELKAQIAADVPKEKLAVTVEKVDKAITQLSTANSALSATLSAFDLTARPPDVGSPRFSATRGSD